jgi:hypothetical protein
MGRNFFSPKFSGRENEMHNVNSIASRVAALIGASAITTLMLFAYFTPAASTPIGLLA